MYFVSRYSDRPKGDPSLPMPLSFTPPKGAVQVLIIPSFTPTIPVSRLKFCQNIETKVGCHTLCAASDEKHADTTHYGVRSVVHVSIPYLLLNQKARVRSLVQKYEANPVLEAFAISNASSSVSNDRMATTGPNVSKSQIRDAVPTLVRTVGA